MPGHNIKRFDLFDFVKTEVDAHNQVGGCQENIHRFALALEISALEGYVIAGILRIQQCTEQLVPADLLANFHRDHIVVEILGIADAIEATDRRNHNDIPSTRQQRIGG